MWPGKTSCWSTAILISWLQRRSCIQKAANFIESSLFQLGIIPSKNAYNQLELFRTALPGNAVELKNMIGF